MNLHRGELLVLKHDVQAVDVVTRIVQSRAAGDAGHTVTERIDHSGNVLVHFIDEFWGNIIIPVQAELLESSDAMTVSQPPVSCPIR